MFFDFLLGRRMAAADDEKEAVGGDAAAEKVGAARGDEYDDVDEASNGSADSAVRLEDVLRQLTEAEQKEEDDALQASFSGISEEDRLVLMQFLPQLELLKEDKNAKDLAEKDSSANMNPPPSSINGFVEQEPSLMKNPQPSSTNDSAEPEPSPETEPLPQVAENSAEQEDPKEADPQPTPFNAIPLSLHESKHEPGTERKSEDSDKLDAIMRELKSIKRQQIITHCLVTVLIVVTAVWQYSEASIALSVKDKVSHPFRAIGGFFSRALLGGEKAQILDMMPSPPTIPQLEVSQLTHLKLPELPHPHVGFPSAVIESIED